MHVCMYVCMHACMYACTYVCECAYTYIIYIYIYIYIACMRGEGCSGFRLRAWRFRGQGLSFLPGSTSRICP